MKTIAMVLFLLVFLVASCSKDADTGTGGGSLPVPQYDTDILFENLPDSVKVESSAIFEVKFEQKDYEGNFLLKIDTIIPTYSFSDWINWDLVPEGESIIPPEALCHVVRRGVQLKLDENILEEEMPVQANRKYHFSFIAPQVVGDYHIIFTVTDQNKKKVQKEVLIKVYSPEISINVFNVDPWLDLKIYDKDFYKQLNQNYSFEPLSEVFEGTETDTFRTYERPKSGYPGQYTYPGIGITVHIKQEGEKGFVYRFTQPQGDESAFLPRWDDDVEHRASTEEQKSGFHCFELLTWSDDISPGVYQYQITLIDYWGKAQTKNITLLAIADPTK